VIFNVLSVFASYLINFAITFFIDRALRCRHHEIGKLILESMAMPSCLSVVCFVIPSFLTQFYHFYQLVIRGWNMHGIMGFIATYMAWMNSGQVTFVIIATLGQFLADDAGTKKYLEDDDDQVFVTESEKLIEEREEEQSQTRRWASGQSLHGCVGHLPWSCYSCPSQHLYLFSSDM